MHTWFCIFFVEFTEASVARITVSSRPYLISCSFVSSHYSYLSIRKPVCRISIVTCCRSFRKRNIFNITVNTYYASVSDRVSSFDYVRFRKEVFNVIVLQCYFNSRSPMFFAVFSHIFVTLSVCTFRKPASACFFTE